ncbi:flavodoxin family protein [Vallitalea guaymasensis]|uniref:Flavodoxin n=1 Tax=Vallitalea guaymasensis TaxID=1185412 RepID=A0A8J8M7Z4_9FIRM|nr:flavodoxin [Vallitalea guaymasensis]QUH27860.1 flavodoxin [Vallitalea guaymasensis]
MDNGKKLIVFYSLGGNTRFIAEEIKKEENADLLELKLKKDIKSKGFLKYLIGGRQAITDKKPELLPYDVNLDDYETIFIGSPIWASHFSPAVNTFLSENAILNKNIALFCCHAGGGEGKAFKHYKERLKGNRFIGEIEIKDPLKAKTESVNKLKNWLKNI